MVKCLRFSFRSVGDVCSGDLNGIGVNKKLYIGKRNYNVDVMLVGGKYLNMVGLSIPELLTGFKLSEAEGRGQFKTCQELRNRHSCLMTERVICSV